MKNNNLHSILVLVINLDRSVERMKFMSSQLEAVGLPYVRVSAVDGKKLNLSSELIDVNKFHRCHGKNPLPGELGCYISHVRAIEYFLNSSKNYCLILEDDVVFDSSLTSVLNRLVDNNLIWDMVKLSGVHSGTPIKIKELDENCFLGVMMTKCTGSSAYMINKKSASRYMEKILPMYLPFDHEFDKGFKYKIMIRGVFPFPVGHSDGDFSGVSTISHGNKSKKFSLYKRIPTHCYRLITELFRLKYALMEIWRNRSFLFFNIIKISSKNSMD